MVASPQLFTRILQFQIDEFSPLFSDVHSESNVMTRTKKRLYGIARKGHSIDTTKVQEIVQTLTDNNNIYIDQVSFSICSLFDSAVKQLFEVDVLNVYMNQKM